MTAIIVSTLVLVAILWFLQLKQNTKIWYPVPFQKGCRVCRNRPGRG